MRGPDRQAILLQGQKTQGQQTNGQQTNRQPRHFRLIERMGKGEVL